MSWVMPTNYGSRAYVTLAINGFIVLMVDLYISSAADTLKKYVSTELGIILFIAVVIVSFLVQYITLRMAKAKINTTVRKDALTSLLLNAAIALMIVSLTLVTLLIAQIAIQSEYYIPILFAVMAIGYGSTAAIMGILTYRLIHWFKLRKSLVLLIYGMAAGAFTANALASGILFEIALSEKPQIFSINSDTVFNWRCEPGSFKCLIITTQSYTMYAYFLLMWSGSVILLSSKIKRIGRIKFWTLVIVPLAAFYFAYVSAYNEIYQIGTAIGANGTNLIMMTLIIALGTSCGVLYAVGFRSVGKLVKGSTVSEYMLVTAYGIIFYFICANSTVGAAGYPPFGTVSVAFVPVAAILIYFGLFSSAVSVAHDTSLRREVKSSIIKKTQLLDSIGTAQMQKEIERNVAEIIRNKSHIFVDETGVDPSLSEDEIQDLVRDVMAEMQRVRTGTSNK